MASCGAPRNSRRAFDGEGVECENSRAGGMLAAAADGSAPNWLATDSRGASILRAFDGKRTFGEIVNHYARETGFELAIDGVVPESRVPSSEEIQLIREAIDPEGFLNKEVRV